MMKNTAKNQTFERIIDKPKDNVICYIRLEVIL